MYVLAHSLSCGLAVVSCFMLWILDSTTTSQLVTCLGGIRVSVDSLSITFVLLTACMTPVALLSSWSNHLVVPSPKLHTKLADNSYPTLDASAYAGCVLLVEIILIGAFIVTDLVSFYVLFEAVLMPM